MGEPIYLNDEAMTIIARILLRSRLRRLHQEEQGCEVQVEMKKSEEEQTAGHA